MFTDRIVEGIKEVIAEYKSGAGFELEIHVKDVTKDVFESLVGGLLKSGRKSEVEHTINVVSPDPSGNKPNVSFIRHQTFHDGVRMNETYVQKTRLRNPPIYLEDYLPYTIHLNREAEARQFKSSQHALVRLRSRISFPDDKWRFDITAVRSGKIDEIGPTLKTIVSQMFGRGITPDTYLDSIPHGIVTSYEVEIEYTGSPADLTIEDFDIVKTVFETVSPEYTQELQMKYELLAVSQAIKYSNAGFKSNPTLKRFVNQAEGLTKNVYMGIYPPVGYYLTDKADGVRCVVRGSPASLTVIADRLIQFVGRKTAMNTPVENSKRNNSPLTPTSRIIKNIDDTTIVDGELLCKGDTCIVYVFDVLMFRQETVSEKPFAQRLDYIPGACNALNAQIENMMNMTVSERYNVYSRVVFVPKTFARIEAEALETSFRRVYSAEHPYVIDGLILTSPNDSYHDTRNLKWKDSDHLTIDFAAMRAPVSLIGKKPFIRRPGFELYLLYVGINNDEQQKLGLDDLPETRELFPETFQDRYHPIHFSPSSEPYAYVYFHANGLPEIDRKIVELRRSGVGTDDAKWDFVHLREDRSLTRGYYGNHFKIAETTYQNYINPFPFEELWRPHAGYFTKTASDIYKNPNAYKRFVISALMKNHMSRVKRAIDLASGRGGDLHRYHEVGVQSVLFVDRDSNAIAELIQRKFDLVDSHRKQSKIEFNQRRVGGEYMSTKIHTSVADLTTDYRALAGRFEGFNYHHGGVDAVVCNFAMHYLCDTVDHLRNVIKLANVMLRVGGVFMFTVMDGRRVFDALRDVPKGSSWTLKEGGVVKYEIRRDYAQDRIANVGQMIAVRLPLADELYTEPLCNLEYVNSELKKHGFMAEIDESFTQMLSVFAKVRPDMYERLSPEDLAYIDLHQYVVVRKERDFKA